MAVYLRVHVLTSGLLNRTVQFVGISAFHTQIADPLIGGTYMTVSICKPLDCAMRVETDSTLPARSC